MLVVNVGIVVLCVLVWGLLLWYVVLGVVRCVVGVGIVGHIGVCVLRVAVVVVVVVVV